MPKTTEYTSTAPTTYADPINVGEVEDDERPDWIGASAFIGVHLACLMAFYTGVSWAAAAMFVFTYTIRMFGITGVFHRYFAHRTYKTSRVFQFVLAWLGTSSAQQGPLWWAAHHRHHHRHSDEPEDIHSPIQKGFFWSHVGWIMCKKYEPTNVKAIPDFAKYPELRFLNNFHILPPIAFALAVYGFGTLLAHFAPGLHTNGFQMLVWGFFISTTLLYHCTFCINSLAHVVGWRRFDTNDHSRNNFFLAVLTLGEGWHNNHHRCPYSERQGFYWWEIDMSHYILRGLAWLGLVWDLQKPPQSIYLEAEKNQQAQPAA
ncbi:MAG: acyl-CoA desaturase [Candidatus Sumerlaeaceae bacterium]